MFVWDYEQGFNLWNDIAHVLQANVYVTLANHYMWQARMRKKNRRARYSCLIWKALIYCCSLLVNVGLKVASKVVKENWEQGTHDWHEDSNIN